MDVQTAEYILDHYLYLLPFEERGPIQMTLASYLRTSLYPDYRLKTDPDPYSVATKYYRKYGWLSEELDASEMLKMGRDQFYILIATGLKERYASEVLINNCPRCGKLCRTPNAKQCRYCAYDWH